MSVCRRVRTTPTQRRFLRKLCFPHRTKASDARNTTFHELTFANNDRRSAATLWLFRSETYYVVLVRKIRELARGVNIQERKKGTRRPRWRRGPGILYLALFS